MKINEILKESRVEYSNAKADHMRDRPYAIDPKLMDILERAAEGADVDVKIVSGGQDPVHIKAAREWDQLQQDMITVRQQTYRYTKTAKYN